jgi:hypothetical protein
MHTAAEILSIGSSSGTANMFPASGLQFHVVFHEHSISQIQAQTATTTWVHDPDGPRYVQGTLPPERSQTQPQRSMCDGCTAAKIVRDLDKVMATDMPKTSPMDDDIDHYFPSLPQSTNG